MPIKQIEIVLPTKQRGFNIITEYIEKALPDLHEVNAGLLNIFLKHTSASLAINENADPDVRVDLENYFSNLVRENEVYYQHTSEGSDDMPSHIKSVMLGCSLSVPISNGKLNLGTWQGIYLCEHRNFASKRKIVLTLYY